MSVNKVLDIDLSKDDVLFYKKYSKTYSRLQKLYNKVSEATEEVTVRGRYNYASYVVLFLNSKDKNIIRDISDKMQENFMQIDEIFISFYEKCSNDDINFKAFCKELNVLNDRKIILYKIDIEHDGAIYASSIEDILSNIKG